MKTLKVIIRILSYNKVLFFTTICFIMFVSLFSLKIILDYIIPNNMLILLYIFFVGIVVFVALRIILSFIQDILFIIFRQKIERNLLFIYVKEIFKLDISQFNQYNMGDILNRITSILNNFQYSFINFIYYIFYAIFISIFISFVLFNINTFLLSIILSFLILHLINFFLFTPFVNKVSSKYYNEKGKISSLLLRIFEGYVYVITLCLKEKFKSEIATKLKTQFLYFFKREIYTNLQRMIQNLLIISNLFLILYFGAQEVFLHKLSIGSLMLFVMLINFLFEPIYRLNEIGRMLQDTGIQLERLYEIIDDKNKDKVSRKFIKDNNVLSTINIIKLENLSFKYDSQKIIFENVNYEFCNGKIYLIYGESGIGKSTFFNLLLRLCPIWLGKIFINDKNHEEYDLDILRKNISLMNQEDYLFTGRIIDNITTFSENINENFVRECLTLSTSDSFVNTMPHGFYTNLEEGGNNLSGGQRQRLCLARVLYENKNIILLDEPTSKMDELNEDIFLNNLNKIKSNKIIIIISHRDKFLTYCDEVIKIENKEFIKQRKKYGNIG